LEDRCYEFNSTATGITDGEWLAIFVRDDAGRIVAGICGNTWGGCLEIRQFWVEEARRKQGLGTSLLGAAEEEARRRGCRKILLTTFSFQAPAFYAKRGFEVVALVGDHPRGHPTAGTSGGGSTYSSGVRNPGLYLELHCRA
jgi:GNAT superfamily N-acetyltransferase